MQENGIQVYEMYEHMFHIKTMQMTLALQRIEMEIKHIVKTDMNRKNKE